MDFIAKKYTLLVGEEPITIWAKNGVIKKAMFMEKKVPFDLDKITIQKIQDQPTKIVNGNIFQDDKAFTQATSKMFSQQLKLAIEKNDKRIMSRFARSDLIPQEMQQDFIQAINQQNGIRAVVVSIINKTNLSIQKLASKVDMYFDKLNDKAANKKLDPYLQSYQKRSLNKAVRNWEIPDEILNKPQDEKLSQMARDFIKQNEKTWNETNSIKKFDSAYDPHHEKMTEFLGQAAKKGYTTLQAQIAFAQQMKYKNLEMNAHEIFKRNSVLENKIKSYQNLASKNETIQDFKLISADKTSMQRLDLLVENKEYQKMDPAEQLKTENQYLYDNEQVKDKSAELKHLLDVKKEAEPKRFTFAKEEIDKEWKIAQAESRSKTIPTQKFMDYSALKFNGVDLNKLNSWKQQMNEMREKGKQVPTPEKVQQFIEGTLKNAKRLEKEGILVQKEENVYSFADERAKDNLYTSLKNKEQEIDITSRVQDLSSEKSFEKLISQDGTIDIEKLSVYAQKLSEIAAMAKDQQNVNINRSELKRDSEMVKAQSNSQENSKGRDR